MARHDDGNRIASVGHADGPRCIRITKFSRQLSIATCLSIRYLAKTLPDSFLKLRSRRSNRHIELNALTRKLLVQLKNGVCKRVIIAQTVPVDRRCVLLIADVNTEKKLRIASQKQFAEW